MIRTIFERFCESGNVEDRSRSGRPTVINQEKVNEVNDFLQTHPGSSVRSVSEASSISPTTTYRIRTEHILLKPYKAQFIQHLIICGRFSSSCRNISNVVAITD